jgi:hypothetical protein
MFGIRKRLSRIQKNISDSEAHDNKKYLLCATRQPLGIWEIIIPLSLVFYRYVLILHYFSVVIFSDN